MRFFEFSHQSLLEKQLSIKDLIKYKGTQKDRIPVFLQKIKDQVPFTIKTKTGVENVVIDPADFQKVDAWIDNPTPRLRLKVKDEDRYFLFTDIVKTKDIGGEDSQHREKIEVGQIGAVQQQLEDAKAGKPFIELIVGNRVVNAASVTKTPELVNGRAPKSDMSIKDENGNSVAWVSLKGRPFRWGGWQHLVNEPEINAWLERVKAVTGKVLDPKQSFGLNISDKIKLKIVYGKNFGGQPGISNVDAVLVDNVELKPADGKFQLTASTVYVNGEVPTGNDEPYILLRYFKDRADRGFKNARGETNTKGETRKVTFLDNDSDVETILKSKQPAQTPEQLPPQV